MVGANLHTHKRIFYLVILVAVLLFAYEIMLNISRWKGVTKILPKRLHCHFR